MMKMSKWIVQQNKPQVQARLMNGLGISSVLANLLINRGYTELDAAREFLNPSLEQLSSPFEMLNMGRCV